MNTITLPKTFWQKMKITGPGLVWATAAIGSGELIISAKIGAEYGFLFIWALWIGIWFKFWIQRGILDLTVLTGKPILELWNETKLGKWITLYWLIFFLLTATGVAGLLGLSASILFIILPIWNIKVWAVIITATIVSLAYFQKYKHFEKTMLMLALILGIGTLLTLFFSTPNISEIFSWGVPTTTAAGLIFLALLGWGAGSGPDLMLPYSGWVAEKGYPNLVVSESQKMPLMNNLDENSIVKTKEWLNIVKLDNILGYIAAGFVATVFMIAGAVFLQPLGIVVEGIEVIKNLSTIFTNSFGSWTFWVFIITAFAAIFSTTFGVFDGGRISLGRLSRMLTNKSDVPIKEIRGNLWYRISLIIFSVIPLILFLGIQRPVLLIIIAGVISAVSMPILAGLVYWSLLKQIPKEYRPNKFYLLNLFIATIIYLFFTIQALMNL